MTLMILIGYKGYETAKCEKADEKITYNPNQSRKDKIINNGISVVFEKEAVH
jgi:hypothetical protein